MKISIVIPTKDREKDLIDCLGTVSGCMCYKPPYS